MDTTPEFRADLYRGTAEYYDRYRLPYPAALVNDLTVRAGISGTGRLLDIACGPGRLTFALCHHFVDVVAVDQEDEAIGFARSVADGRGASHVRWFSSRAEDIELDGGFELITIGDAFHRLDRRRMSRLAAQWLEPGGHLALVWTSIPWAGADPWQRATADIVVKWTQTAGSSGNVPSGLADSFAAAPNEVVIADAGLTPLGRWDCTVPYIWTLETLAGFAYSTSILSRQELGKHTAGFEHDLHERLLAVRPDGRFEEQVSFAYDLAQRP